MSPASFHALPTSNALDAIAWIISRSPPAENARPAPVTTMTLVSSSSAMSSHTRLNSQCRRALVALSTSGRLIVISRMPSPLCSNRRCWYSLYFIFFTLAANDTVARAAVPAFRRMNSGMGRRGRTRARRPAPLAFVNVDDLVEQRDRFGLRTLKAVAADDRAVAATGLNPANGVQERFVGFLHAARENYDSASGECGLHHVRDASGQRFERNLLRVVNFFGLGKFDEGSRGLDLDDSRAEL